MKLLNSLAVSLFISMVSAETYILTFNSLDRLDQVKKDLIEAGGTITHQFSLIKGFSVDIPGSQIDSYLSQVEAQNAKDFNVEEEKLVTAYQPS